MYLVLIAWFYVALMMAIAEALSPIGSVLGAVFTFLLYGLLPMAVVGYILNAPARRKARLAQAAAEASDHPSSNASSGTPDTSSESTGAPIASVRKEP